MHMAMTTAVSMSDSVTIASSHTPSTVTPSMAAAPAEAARTPPVRHPMAAASATTPGHRMVSSAHRTPRTAPSRPSANGLKMLVNSQCVLLFSTVHM